MSKKYSVSDQVKFLGEWFDTWVDYQKEDFLLILLQALKPNDHVNGIVSSISEVNVTGRRPSLYDCQLKLFQEWFLAFTPEDQSKFVDNLKERDCEFYENLNKKLLGVDLDEETIVQGTNGIVISSKDDDTSACSSVSPLSSISQPQSPRLCGENVNSFEAENDKSPTKETDTKLSPCSKKTLKEESGTSQQELPIMQQNCPIVEQESLGKLDENKLATLEQTKLATQELSSVEKKSLVTSEVNLVIQQELSATEQGSLVTSEEIQVTTLEEFSDVKQESQVACDENQLTTQQKTFVAQQEPLVPQQEQKTSPQKSETLQQECQHDSENPELESEREESQL